MQKRRKEIKRARERTYKEWGTKPLKVSLIAAMCKATMVARFNRHFIILVSYYCRTITPTQDVLYIQTYTGRHTDTNKHIVVHTCAQTSTLKHSIRAVMCVYTALINSKPHRCFHFAVLS